MKKTIIIMMIFMSIFLLGCSDSAMDDGEEYILSVAMDSPEDTVTYLYAEKFAEILDRKTQGRTKTYLYSNGQLGNDVEIAEGVQYGNISFVVQTTAPQVNIIPQLAVLDLPNLFKDVHIAREVFDGSFFDTLAQYYEENNIRLLGYADQGFRVMSSNLRIDSIDDFSGIKVRTMENPYHLKYWESIGANPTPMAFSEVYIGLQQGTIDAQENPVETIVSSRIYEQQDYIIETNHLLHTLSLIGSVEILDRLPDDIEELVYEAAREATIWARETADSRVEDRYNIIRDSGSEIIIPSQLLMEEISQDSQSVYQIIRNKIGDELVDELLETIKNVEDKMD